MKPARPLKVERFAGPESQRHPHRQQAIVSKEDESAQRQQMTSNSTGRSFPSINSAVFPVRASNAPGRVVRSTFGLDVPPSPWPAARFFAPVAHVLLAFTTAFSMEPTRPRPGLGQVCKNAALLVEATKLALKALSLLRSDPKRSNHFMRSAPRSLTPGLYSSMSGLTRRWPLGSLPRAQKSVP